MHARNRLLTALLTGALLGALLPAAAAANEIVPGRPGRYELSSITIDATSGDCRATYATPVEGNRWMLGADATVRVVSNPAGVHVTCRFTDMSRLIERNAEVGHTDACELVTATMTLTGGWGIATSAANIGEGEEGGNTFVACRFKSKPAPKEARSVTPHEIGAAGVTEGAEAVRPERAGKTRGPAKKAPVAGSHRAQRRQDFASPVRTSPQSRSGKATVTSKGGTNTAGDGSTVKTGGARKAERGSSMAKRGR